MVDSKLTVKQSKRDRCTDAHVLWYEQQIRKTQAGKDKSGINWQESLDWYKKQVGR